MDPDVLVEWDLIEQVVSVLPVIFKKVNNERKTGQSYYCGCWSRSVSPSVGWSIQLVSQITLFSLSVSFLGHSCLRLVSQKSHSDTYVSQSVSHSEYPWQSLVIEVFYCFSESSAMKFHHVQFVYTHLLQVCLNYIEQEEGATVFNIIVCVYVWLISSAFGSNIVVLTHTLFFCLCSQDNTVWPHLLLVLYSPLLKSGKCKVNFGSFRGLKNF